MHDAKCLLLPSNLPASIPRANWIQCCLIDLRERQGVFSKRPCQSLPALSGRANALFFKSIH